MLRFSSPFNILRIRSPCYLCLLLTGTFGRYRAKVRDKYQVLLRSQNESGPVRFFLFGHVLDAMSKGPTGTLKSRRTEMLKGVLEHAVFSTAKSGGNVCLEKLKQNAFGRVHLSASVSLPRVNGRIFCQFQMPPGRRTSS